jgi:hypothetical protein
MDVDDRIKLKSTLKEYCARAWSRLIELKVGTTGEIFETE